MQSTGFAGPDAVARGRAEIKSRLLSTVSLTAGPKPVPQERGSRDAQVCSDGELPLPDGKQPEAAGAPAAGDDEAAEQRSREVKWIEPVFVEPVAADGAGEQDVRTDAVVDDTRAPHSPPAPAEADGATTGIAPLEEAPPRSRPARFRWGRRSAASPELGPAAATQSPEPAAQREALLEEIAALRGTLAAERAAAAARIAALEEALRAQHKATPAEDATGSSKIAAEREAAADEIAALRLTLTAQLEAAADEIATLRKILTAEREAAADEIAMLRTILAAQQEAAVARTTRLKAVLRDTTPSAAASD